MRQFAKFAKTPLYRGYFQNHHQLCPAFLTFFKKFVSPLVTIAKTPRKGHTLSKLFSKNFHLLPGLFPKRHLLVLPLSEKIRKNLHFTTDYQDCHPILLHPFSTFLKKSIAPLSRLYPKHPPVALLLLEKIQKIFSTPLIIKITPLFCNTLFELFSKIFIPTLLTITFSLLFVSLPNATFLKKSPLHHCISPFYPQKDTPLPEFFQKSVALCQ